MTRLLWVNHFAVAPDAGGGTRHFELGRELVGLGWDVTIAASDLNLQSRVYARRESAADRRVIRETRDGVHFAWLWANSYVRNDWRRLMNWLTFGRSLLAAADTLPRADVVIGSSPHLFAAAAAARLARRRGARFVLEVRDLWPESLEVAGRRKGATYGVFRVIADRLYRDADAIIVLAGGVRDHLVARGVPGDRIVFAPNGVSVADFARTSRERRAGLRLVYAGAHGPANGLDTVLDAAARLRGVDDVRIVLVGDGPAKPDLVARAAALGLDNVEFRAPVPKRDMPELMADCDAGLMVLKPLPLFAFGVSPNKLFDYWGAGLPVVNNVPGEVADYVTEAGGGVQAAPGDGAALADAVMQLRAASADERIAMGARGRAWVTAHRDRPVVAAALDAALRRVLAAAS